MPWMVPLLGNKEGETVNKAEKLLPANIAEWFGGLSTLELWGYGAVAIAVVIVLLLCLVAKAEEGDDDDTVHRARLVGSDGKTIQEWEIYGGYDYDDAELNAITVQDKEIHVLAGPGLAIIVEEK